MDCRPCELTDSDIERLERVYRENARVMGVDYEITVVCGVVLCDGWDEYGEHPIHGPRELWED